MSSFKPLPLDVLQQNIKDLIALELKDKKVGDVDNLVEPRRSQLKALNHILAEFAKFDMVAGLSAEQKKIVDRNNVLIGEMSHSEFDDASKQSILIGALLDLKEAIGREYQPEKPGFLARMRAYLNGDPNKSLVYKNIDKTMGVVEAIVVNPTDSKAQENDTQAQEANKLNSEEVAFYKNCHQAFLKMYGLKLRADLENFDRSKLSPPKPLIDRSKFGSVNSLMKSLDPEGRGGLRVHQMHNEKLHAELNAFKKDELKKVDTKTTDFIAAMRREHVLKVQAERQQLRSNNDTQSEEALSDIQNIISPRRP